MKSFVWWLREQRDGDPDFEQAYAGLYEYGPSYFKSRGDAVPDPIDFKAHLMVVDPPLHSSAIDDLIRQLVIADATWRTDEFSDNPDAPMPESMAGTVIHAKSLPTVPCGFRDLDGTRCTKTAVEGAARCVDHGGAITDPQVRGSLLLLAYAQMLHGSRVAVETLMAVAEHSTNDLARVQAAKELLDRAGLTPEQTVTVQVADKATDTRTDVLDRIKSHLDTVRDRLLPPAESDDDIVDAEIVEESSDGAAA